MKKIKKLIILLVSGIFVTAGLQAQDNSQQLVVPLSNPDKPGKLIVSLNSGKINVTGYTGKEVIAEVATDQKTYEAGTRDGLKQIPNKSIGLTAKEEDNVVKINSSNWNKEINLSIKVPKNFDLTLKGINGGEITVNNVNGEMDVNNINGGISMSNISGSVVASSQNGNIKVGFVSVKGNTPMAFSTFNGDVDVTFPASLKATLKMRSDQGEIYSDFDMNIKKSVPKVENKKEEGVYKIAMEEWVIADVNGGGPEMSFKNFNGDILIRKK